MQTQDGWAASPNGALKLMGSNDRFAGLGAAAVSWREVKGEKDLSSRAQVSMISPSQGNQQRALAFS